MLSFNFSFLKWRRNHKVTRLFLLTIILLISNVITGSAEMWINEYGGIVGYAYTLVSVVVFLMIVTKLSLKIEASKKKKLKTEASSAISLFSRGKPDYRSGILYSEAKQAFNSGHFMEVIKLAKEAEEIYPYEISILKELDSIRSKIPESNKSYFKETGLLINKSMKLLKEGDFKASTKLASEAKVKFKEEFETAKYEKEKADLIKEMDDIMEG